MYFEYPYKFIASPRSAATHNCTATQTDFLFPTTTVMPNEVRHLTIEHYALRIKKGRLATTFNL